MANFRQLHCKMWSSDNWFINLNPEMKLLFIYLFSNERASMTGLYEIPVRIVSFETGLTRDCVQDAIEVFTKADKVEYDFESGVIWIKNMAKYQVQNNPNEHIRKRIADDMRNVPDCELKRRCVDTLSVRYGYSSDAIVSSSIVSSSLLSSEERGTGGKTENVFTVYEHNIGVLTPMIADALKDAEITYGPVWICAAIQEAVASNARSWKYCEAILKRWSRDGFKAPKAPSGKSSPEDVSEHNRRVIEELAK